MACQDSECCNESVPHTSDPLEVMGVLLQLLLGSQQYELSIPADAASSDYRRIGIQDLQQNLLTVLAEVGGAVARGISPKK